MLSVSTFSVFLPSSSNSWMDWVSPAPGRNPRRIASGHNLFMVSLRLSRGSGISVDGVGRKGVKTDSDVLGAALFGRTVLHPLTAVSNDGLACAHIKTLGCSLHPQHPFENQSEFIELRRLAGFHPACRTTHSRD